VIALLMLLPRSYTVTGMESPNKCQAASGSLESLRLRNSLRNFDRSAEASCPKLVSWHSIAR